jgi:type IV secretion system protein VirB10
MDQIQQPTEKFKKFKPLIFPAAIIIALLVLTGHILRHPTNRQQQKIYRQEAMASDAGSDLPVQRTAKAPVISPSTPVVVARPLTQAEQQQQQQNMQLQMQEAMNKLQKEEDRKQKEEEAELKAEHSGIMVAPVAANGQEHSAAIAEKKDPTVELVEAALRAGKPEPDPAPYVEKKGDKDKADFSIPIGATNGWKEYPPDDRNHTIYQGTLVHTILLSGIQSDMTGPVECRTAEDVRSFDGQHVLIPAGTVVFGHTQAVQTIGQSRVGLAFDYMRMPDAFEMTLQNLGAQSPDGSSGVKGHVNNHFLRAFGTSAAIGLLGAASMWNTNSGYNMSGSDAFRLGIGSAMSQTAMQTFSRYALIPPTITIKPQTPVDMYMVGDLHPPYVEEHEIVTGSAAPESGSTQTAKK